MFGGTLYDKKYLRRNRYESIYRHRTIKEVGRDTTK